MPSIFRSQASVYVLIAAVLLLVGLNSIRSRPGEGAPGSLESASAAEGASSGTDRDSSGAGSGPGTGEEQFSIDAGSRGLVVDVSGAVSRPGVSRFEDGDRVIDAIRRAGGPARGALPGAINRAALLADGQQVVVPARATGGAGNRSAGAAATAVSGVGGSGPISLGNATSEQLEEIEGIGPVTAADILEFRDSHGGIGSIEELDQVSGIGPVTMEALRSRLQP
jgi:competence protein ComEA